jgi:hypothetical protein
MSEVSRNRVYQARQLFGLADMAGNWDHAAAKLTRNGVKRVLFAAADHGGSAFARESGGDGFADAPAPAGDDSDLAVELHEHLSFESG